MASRKHTSPRQKENGPPPPEPSPSRRRIDLEVMTVDELAEYLDLSPSTIYKKVQSRDIPFTKIGGLTRFTRRSIETWLARNTSVPHESLYDEFARLQNRYHFKKWLEGRGIDPTRLTEDQLTELVTQALADLRSETEQES